MDMGNSCISAIKHKGKVFHGGGADHADIIPQILKDYPEKQHEKEAMKMQFGYLHKPTNKFIDQVAYWKGQRKTLKKESEMILGDPDTTGKNLTEHIGRDFVPAMKDPNRKPNFEIKEAIDFETGAVSAIKYHNVIHHGENHGKMHHYHLVEKIKSHHNISDDEFDKQFNEGKIHMGTYHHKTNRFFHDNNINQSENVHKHIEHKGESKEDKIYEDVHHGESTLNYPNGLHARPSTILIKKAKQFKSNIHIATSKDGPWHDAKSLVKVMSARIPEKSPIHVRAEGEDAHDAVHHITKLFHNNFSMNEDITPDGSVSAIYYKGKVYHGDGASHYRVMQKILDKHKIPEKYHDREAMKMDYGYLHRETRKYASTTSKRGIYDHSDIHSINENFEETRFVKYKGKMYKEKKGEREIHYDILNRIIKKHKLTQDDVDNNIDQFEFGKIRNGVASAKDTHDSDINISPDDKRRITKNFAGRIIMNQARERQQGLHEYQTSYGSVSALKYKGKIYYGGGSGDDHGHIIGRVLNHLKIPEDKHDDVAMKFNYGYYHPQKDAYEDDKNNKITRNHNFQHVIRI